MNKFVEHSDLNITITGIKFKQDEIVIDCLPFYSKKKKPFMYPIDRKLNEEIVHSLVIGNSYRITQDKMFNGYRNIYKWKQVVCINDTQQKARTLDGLFE